MSNSRGYLQSFNFPEKTIKKLKKLSLDLEKPMNRILEELIDKKFEEEEKIQEEYIHGILKIN